MHDVSLAALTDARMAVRTHARRQRAQQRAGFQRQRGLHAVGRATVAEEVGMRAVPSEQIEGVWVLSKLN